MLLGEFDDMIQISLLFLRQKGGVVNEDLLLRLVKRSGKPELMFVNFIVCIGVSPPTLKNTPPLSSQAPSLPLNLQTAQPLLFRQSPLYIGFLGPPSPNLKVRFFSETPKYHSFSSLRIQ